MDRRPWRFARGHRPRIEALEARTLLNAGQLDPTFGEGGIALAPRGVTSTSGFRAIALQPDGKLVASEATGFSLDAALGRYTQDARPDPSFGDGGLIPKVFANFAALGKGPPYLNDGYGLIVRPDGKVLVAGDVVPADNLAGPSFGVIAQFNPDGQADPTFGTDGLALTPAGSLPTGPMVLQPDGKVVAATGTGLIRLNPDGSADPSFGSGGVANPMLDPTAGFQALALQGDGKIVAVGETPNLPGRLLPTDFVVARYNPDGSLDTSFGHGGEAVTPFPSGNAAADATPPSAGP